MRNFFNRQMALLSKLGISITGSRTLAVTGRKSGQWADDFYARLS
jgi:hypothetical protein